MGHKDLSTAQRFRDIYILGATNVGKSTVLNQLIKNKLIYSTASNKKKLTTSLIPATTMNIIPFQVTNQLNTRLLDSPGLITEHNLCLKLTDDEYKMLIPKKTIKPSSYKIKRGQCVILGSLARLDCDDIFDEEENDQNEEDFFYLTVFAAPTCSVHVTRIDKADEIIAQHSGNLLRPINKIERMLDDP